jgi:hypothetical protein
MQIFIGRIEIDTYMDRDAGTITDMDMNTNRGHRHGQKIWTKDMEFSELRYPQDARVLMAPYG